MLARHFNPRCSSLLRNARCLSLSPSSTGLRIGHNRTVPPVERHGRLAAYVAAWRVLEWRQVLRIPFPPADSTQIHATRLPSPLRGVKRQNITRHLPGEVRAWALDAAQDLLLFIEHNEDGPPYPVHCISTKTGRRHPRAAILPPLEEEEDPWLDSNEDTARVHGLLAGVAHAGWLRVFEWRTGTLLLEVPCSDDFVFLDNSHVLTTTFDPDTLQPSILLYPLSCSQPSNTPTQCFNLPRLNPTLNGSEVFVRLAADSPPPTSRAGAFHADPSPKHRALFIRLEVFSLSGTSLGGDDHASTLCIPLEFFASVMRGVWQPPSIIEKDASGTSIVHWHVWGPSACGIVPPSADTPSEPGVFGFRAARVVSASSLTTPPPAATTTSPDGDPAFEPEPAPFSADTSGVFFEVFDFHPGRVALARAALEGSRTALQNARGSEAAAGADTIAEDILSEDLNAGAWSIQTSAGLDTRIWDVSPLDTQPIKPDVGAASRLQLPYILSRRRIPAEHVLGQSGGKALLTEDALLYVPVRDFVTGEPEEYVAFVF